MGDHSGEEKDRYEIDVENVGSSDHDITSDVDVSDADIALEIAKKTKGLEITPAQNRAVLRKLDIWVTPLICVIYAIQYMDKVTISYTSIMGLRKDLNLVGNHFTYLGTGFYLGYLAFEVVAVRLLQRFPLIRTLSIFIFIWGAVLVLNAASFNFGSILASRIFLGVFESSVSPALMLITAAWYKKEEQFLRVTFWFSSNGLGNILGGTIAYAIARHQASIALHSWRVLFIVTGFLTIILSILLFFHLSDTPAGAWFLNEEEKLIAVERIRDNQQAFGNKKFKWHQFREVWRDPRTYLYTLHGLTSTIPNGGMGSFSSILINESFGYSPLDALLMGLPGGAFQISSAILVYLLVTAFGHRTLVGIGVSSIAVIGSFMLAFASDKHVQLGGYYLVNYGGITWVTCLALVTTNTLGRTKKSVVSAIYFIAYCAGNAVGSQVFRAKDAPDYVPAKVTIAVMNLLSLIILGLLYLYNIWENKRRDAEKKRLGDSYFNPPENYEFMDLTDFENKNFRYFV